MSVPPTLFLGHLETLFYGHSYMELQCGPLDGASRDEAFVVQNSQALPLLT